ncbi:MAG: hypothetical protein KC478_14415 [Bacteriovoracaceae bacterium]|nr:hypothetical protein [Bacteriovoracaceae bacterium]
MCFFNKCVLWQCENFPKYEFLGVFKKVEYQCEENNNRGSTCYTSADRYRHASEAVVNFIPLAVEQGVQIKVQDSRFPFRAPILEYIFRDKTSNSNETLTCSTKVIDGIQEIEMRSSSSLDSVVFKSHTVLRKKGETIEFEISSEYRGETSKYLFRLVE